MVSCAAVELAVGGGALVLVSKVVEDRVVLDSGGMVVDDSALDAVVGKDVEGRVVGRVVLELGGVEGSVVVDGTVVALVGSETDTLTPPRPVLDWPAPAPGVSWRLWNRSS